MLTRLRAEEHGVAMIMALAVAFPTVTATATEEIASQISAVQSSTTGAVDAIRRIARRHPAELVLRIAPLRVAVVPAAENMPSGHSIKSHSGGRASLSQ